MALAEWITGQEGEDNYAGEKVVKVPVSAWHKESRNGTPFVSGAISVAKTEKEEIPF
jgi:hypothetical protein